jgi:hypothetical protein
MRLFRHIRPVLSALFGFLPAIGLMLCVELFAHPLEARPLTNSDADLDVDFGMNGVVTTTIPGRITRLYSAGDGFLAQLDDLRIARFDAAGQLISNVMTLTPPMRLTVYGWVIQPDGKSILFGTITATISMSDVAALVRLRADGSIDTSFGQAGWVTHWISEESKLSDAFTSVEVDSFGRIIAYESALIYAGRNTGRSCAMARYSTNGLPDPLFGSGGFTQTRCVGTLNMVPSADGRISGIGFYQNAFFPYVSSNVSLWQLAANGDEKFAAIPEFSLTSGSIVVEGISAVIQDDGKLVSLLSRSA